MFNKKYMCSIHSQPKNGYYLELVSLAKSNGNEYLTA